MTRATVLIPTHDHASTLDLAVGSALAQTVADIEVIVVGDGVGDDTRDVMADLLRADERTCFLDRPKGERHGELHRDEALTSAHGEIVCYLSDDDLWLPEHLETMEALLRHAQFGHALPLAIAPDGGLQTPAVDLASAYWRDRVLHVENRVPLSCGGHTLAAYRQLAVGWRPAPPDIPTDLHFWRRFLARSDFVCASGLDPTVLHFPSPMRTTATAEERRAELEAWSSRLADDAGKSCWRRSVAARVEFERAGSEEHRIRLWELAQSLEARLAAIDAERVEATTRAETAERLAAERDHALAERDQLLAERDQALAECDQALAVVSAELGRTRDALHARSAAHDALQSEHEATTAELHAVNLELERTRSTITWRVRGWLLRRRISRPVVSVLRAWRARRAARGASAR